MGWEWKLFAMAIGALTAIGAFVFPIDAFAQDGGTAIVADGGGGVSRPAVDTASAPEIDILPLIKLAVAAARSGEWILLATLLLLVIVGAGLKLSGQMRKLNVPWLASIGDWISGDEGKAILSFSAGFLTIITGGLTSGVDFSLGLVSAGFVGSWTAMGAWGFWRKIVARRLERHTGLKLGTDAGKPKAS